MGMTYIFDFAKGVAKRVCDKFSIAFPKSYLKEKRKKRFQFIGVI